MSMDSLRFAPPSPSEAPSCSMVERVARAKWKARCEYFGEPVTELPADDRMDYALHQARAAIEAMREPTDAMLIAADKAAQKTVGLAWLMLIYPAMIDAALPVPKAEGDAPVPATEGSHQ